MRKTKITNEREKAVLLPILVDTLSLQEMLSSGRPEAVKIGEEAGARVQRGRRVFWNVRKVQEYIETISE